MRTLILCAMLAVGACDVNSYDNPSVRCNVRKIDDSIRCVVCTGYGFSTTPSVSCDWTPKPTTTPKEP